MLGCRCVLGVLVFGLFGITGWAQSVTLQWDPSGDPDIAGYNLYRSTQSGGYFSRLNQTPLSSTSFTDSTLGYDTVYFYVCTAINKAGLESGFSNEVTFSLPRPTAPLEARTDKAATLEDVAVSVSVLGNDSIDLSSSPKIAVVEAPRFGTASVRGEQVIYSPLRDFNGTDQFTYAVRTGDGRSAEAIVVVEVIPVNDPPVARADRAVTGIDQSLVIEVLANDGDPEGDQLEVIGVGVAANGKAEVMPEGRVRYTPRSGFQGSDRFNYTISDGSESASAQIDFLVESQTAEQDALLFPLSFQNSSEWLNDTYLGFAVLNARDFFDRITVQAFGGEGLEVVAARTEEAVPAMGQRALLGSELPAAAAGAAYLSAASFSSGLQGFFMVGDYESRRIDGVGGRPDQGRDLYFPEVLMSIGADTVVHLTNLEEKPGKVSMLLIDAGMRRPVTWSGMIPASGVLQGSIADFFGHRDGLDGYLHLSSDVRIVGYEVLAGRDWIAAASAQVPRYSTSWMTPHIFADREGGDTILRILNTAILGIEAKVAVYSDDGDPISEHPVYLPARTMTVLAASTIFKDLIAKRGALAGSLELTFPSAVRPPIVGTVSYQSSRFKTLLPLATKPLNETLFAQVAHSADGKIFTGLAVFNPTAGYATITVNAYDSNGQVQAARSFRLAPKARRSDLLGGEGYFGPDFEQIRGHLRVRSDRPVVSVLTFGDSDGEFLSALEGQEVK